VSRRKQIWIALSVLAVGLPLAAILGLFTYMVATATPLHPDKEKVPSVASASPTPKWANAVARGRQIARASLTDQNLPGVSVAVGVGGDIVWAEGFGWADLENHVKVTPDTLFRIGSASKVLTSAAVGLLLEQGKLNLDDKIQVYVPEFPEKQWPVTLRQVMGHVGGVRNDAGDEEPLTPAAGCVKTIEGLQRFANRPLLFEPGSKFRYSNYGWILVSAAVERVAKEPFYKFMREQIFDPLGMTDTMADSATTPMADRAQFYFPRFAGDPRYGPQEPRDVDYSCFAGSSAFLSTPSDLVRFGMAMNRGKLLKPTTVHVLQASQHLASGQETGYGLGWDLETITVSGVQTTVVGHDGELMGGMVASLVTFPDQPLVVAVTSNTSYAKTFALASSLAQAFADR
jgi:CubicO group peptidase (beta-lactamase class C family)